MKTTLPLALKKQITVLCRRYESLAASRPLTITIPKRQARVTVEWNSDNTVEITDFKPSTDWDQAYKSTEIALINMSIQDFIDDVAAFGKANFGYRDWLWETVLWNYRSESGEKFDPADYKWVKKYIQKDQ